MKVQETVGLVIVCLILTGGLLWFSAEPIIPVYRPQVSPVVTPAMRPGGRQDAFGVEGVRDVLYLETETGQKIATLKCQSGAMWEGEAKDLGCTCYIEDIMNKVRLRFVGSGVTGSDYQAWTGDGDTEPHAVFTINGRKYLLFSFPAEKGL